MTGAIVGSVQPAELGRAGWLLVGAALVGPTTALRVLDTAERLAGPGGDLVAELRRRLVADAAKPRPEVIGSPVDAARTAAYCADLLDWVQNGIALLGPGPMARICFHLEAGGASAVLTGMQVDLLRQIRHALVAVTSGDATKAAEANARFGELLQLLPLDEQLEDR